MKHSTLMMLPLIAILFSCNRSGQNPFFSEYETPFQTPPFQLIHEKHYMPAFKAGIRQHKAEIQAIANNPEAPTFVNTFVALEKSGELLTRVENVFYNLNSANTSDRLQKIAKDVAPLRAAHYDDILMNEKLFQRIKTLYDIRENLGLTVEQNKLLEKQYKDFVRGGANLDEEKKERLRQINEELSMLSLQFSENILAENNRFEMMIEDEGDLSGLPEDVVKAAAETAAERGHEGKWVFTIHKPSLIPFLQYSDRRHLREKMFMAYINKGNHNDDLDNKAILTKMAALRVERANLLGYPTHADYILEENMAKTPEQVYDFLNRIWTPALKVARQEARDLQAMIDGEGGDFTLEPWDWWYYSEKLRKAKYDLDDEMLRPYFQMENVRKGVFDLATRLYGIQFEKRTDIPVYHEDVTVYEVKEADGSHIGILYTDYFPRASKRGGAWMNEYRSQSRIDGVEKTPVVCNIGNFSKPTAEKPSLLSLDETLTLFHEFGHALHGLLSNCTYPSLSGTNVARDFVELPSQIMENWALEPEMLKIYATHYKTGEPIPDDLIKKIRQSNLFNQGFATVEYMAASFLDMDWHTLTSPEEPDAIQFENESMERIGLIPQIAVRYRSPYFLHIFAGGYSSGYYSYIWAEVLDKDAFQAFRETGLFNRETAQSFRENIISRGGTEDPMVLYKRFRGREPRIQPLLKGRGLI